MPLRTVLATTGLAALIGVFLVLPPGAGAEAASASLPTPTPGLASRSGSPGSTRSASAGAAVASDLPPSAWSTPVKVSGQTVAAWWPTIAADDTGTVHIVWNGSFTDGPQYEQTSTTGAAPADFPNMDIADRTTHTVAGLFYARSDGDGRWTEPNDIALVWAGHALRSSIAVDQGGRLHLVYKGLGKLVPDKLNPPSSLGPQELWYTSSDEETAGSVHSWSTPHQLTRATEGYYSDVAIDHNGVIHTVWTESDKGTWLIYYSHSADGGATWSNRIALQDSGLVWWYRAHLVVDAHNRVHVTWENTDPQHLASTREAMYAVSSDGGTTWSKVRFGGRSDPSDASKIGPGPQQPSVGVDGQGLVLLVFREPGTNRIKYMTSTDGATWSPANPISGVGQGVARPYDSYDMVTDGAGHVHVAMAGYLEGSSTIALLHSEWDGHAWSRPDVITGSPLYPEYPKLALSGNRLHVTWFDGDRPGIERSPVSVRYSSRLIAAPSMTRSSWVPVPAVPTRAPLSTPTPVPAPQFATPQLADSHRIDAPLGGPAFLASARQQPVFPLVVAVIPSMLVLGAVVAFKLELFKRKR